MIRNDLVITVVFKGLIAMIHLDPIGKKLTQQGFDTFAVLDKLPEMVATLTALAAHLEAHPSSTRTVLGLHLWQSVFAAVHGIKSGDTAVIDNLVESTKNYGTLLASGDVESQQIAHNHLLEALKAYQAANRLNSDGDAELYDLANDAIAKADAAKLETKPKQSWQVTLCKEADLDGTLDCWLNTGEGLEKTPIRVVYVTETQLNLIAAAPDLLKALKGLMDNEHMSLEMCHNCGYEETYWSEHFKKAKAAIAKAESQ
jgi:hypothetical protein